MTRHLLVVGAQRCGTTYLHDVLDGHPDVAMARPARPEPKVLLSDELVANGLSWYHRTYFGHAGDAQVLGEKSTSYLDHPEVAARAIALLGDPLVLVQLRDPVERAISHWAFSSDSGLETRPLDEALEASLEGPRPWDPEVTSVSPYAYLERGRYAEQLTPWLSRFGARLRVLMLEELVTDPAVVAGLFAWLRVGPGTGAAPERPVNASSQPRPALDEGLRTRLRAYFEDSDRALTALLGRPLPWIHDPADSRSTSL